MSAGEVKDDSVNGLGLQHVSDVEETDAFADVVMAGDCTDGSVGERHGVPREGNHLCAI